MRKITTLVLASPALATVAQNTPENEIQDPLTFNIATFNIAMKSLDSKEWHWTNSNRKEAVYQIIYDNDWDVFGLNECEFGS